MTWIYTGSNVWWKSLDSKKHPMTIIFQKPECLKCFKKYDTNEIYCNSTTWEIPYNYQKDLYGEKIYCNDCYHLLNRKKNIIYNLLKREIGKYKFSNY